MLKHTQSPLTPGDVTKAFEHIQANTAEYKIRKEKLGLLALDVSGQLGGAAEPSPSLG